jgi:hypothetical protein
MGGEDSGALLRRISYPNLPEDHVLLKKEIDAHLEKREFEDAFNKVRIV